MRSGSFKSFGVGGFIACATIPYEFGSGLYCNKTYCLQKLYEYIDQLKVHRRWEMEMASKRQLHLGAFMRPTTIHTGAWRFPGAYPDANFNLAHLQRFAQTLERGKFDAFFMADRSEERRVGKEW